MNILIVDDDPNARKTLGKILQAKGFEVEEAGTGSEAVRSCGAKFFNLALIDVRLPDMSGLEVLKAVHALNEETIAIMMTGYASLDSSIEAMNQGAYSYFIKPINIDAALLVMEKGLEKQQLSMENKRLLKELQEANEKLKEMNERKSSFVANVSHELRNPLAVIKEAMTLILDRSVGEVSAEQKEILDIGKHSTERLIRLVSDLLDLAKIEAGRMQINRETIDILPFMKGLLIPYLSQISRKRMTIQENISPDIGVLWADRDKLSQVVVNLLNNAIKYTPEGGNITVKIAGDDGEVCFEIADTGPGIPEEYLKKIFDKFERISSEKQEGTGLGLAIAKDIIELHKGKIWIESEVGKGSHFIFTVPRNFRA